MTCTVTGTLYSPDGVPLPDTRVTIHSPAIYAVAGGASMPVRVEVVTDGGGVLAVDLLPGSYTMRWGDACGHYSSPLSIPDEASAALEDLLIAAPIPVRAPGPAIRPTRGEAQAYSASHPGVMVVVPTGPGEPGAMYLGGVLVWDMQAGAPPVGMTFGLETEGGDVLITEDGDLLVGEY